MNKFSKFLFLSVIFSLVFSFYPPEARADSINCKIDRWAQTSPGSLTVDVDWAAFVTGGGGTPYDIYIDWGDGKVNELVGKLDTSNGSADSGFVQHLYPAYGPYTILIHSGPGCRDPYPIRVDPIIVSNPMGTVCFQSNVPTSLLLTNPAAAFPHGYTGMDHDCFDDTAGAWTLSNVPALAGYTGPVITPSTNTQNVPDGGAISWNIVYSQNKYRCSGGGSCILDNVSGNTTSSNCNNSCSVSAGPTVSISASPTTVTTGNASVISWSSVNATSCNVTPNNWSGISGSQSTGALFATTMYTVTCTGPGGTASNSVNVNVATVGATTVSVTASPNSIGNGGYSTISWNIGGNPTSCSAFGDWTTPGTFSGSVVAGPLTSNKNYGLTCSGPGGTASDSATVTVAAVSAPVVTLTASPANISSGGNSILTWTVSGQASSCTASGGTWSGPLSISGGAQQTPGLTSTQTYNISCTGPGGTGTASATVTVTGVPSVVLKGWCPSSVPQSSPVSGSANCDYNSMGGLVWTKANVSYCEIYRGSTDLGSDGQWAGQQAGVGPLTSSQTHTIICNASDGSGNVTSTFTHNVASPDLTAGGVAPNSATAGIPLLFTGQVSNVGTGGTGAGFSNLFQVSNAANGGGTISTVSVNSSPALTAGASGNVTSSSFTFASAGTYSVRVCADNDASFNGTISESNEGNNCGGWTNVTVSNPVSAPTVSLSALPTSVVTNGSSTLTWTVGGQATSCSASGGWSGAKSTSGGNQLIGSITTDTTYTITCVGPGGTAVDSATVTVTNPPSVSLSASPTSVGTGGSSNLTWTTSGTITSCTASGGWSGAKSVTGGSQSTGSISSATTYNITCTGPGGTSSDSVTVSITPGPVVTLSASPTSVASGGSSTLTWTVSGSVSSCAASGSSSWSGAKSTAGGSQTISGITTDLTFTLSCSGPGGTTVQSATVTVISAPSVTLTATPTSVASGGSSTLTWSTSGNITSCTASGGWSGGKSTAGGNQSTGAISSPTTFTISCTGPGGTSNDSVTVNITSGPVVTLSATPSSVASGGTTSIGWTVSGSVSSCTASGGWSGAKSVTGGSQTTSALFADTTFTLTCTGAGGTTSQTVTVSVLSAPGVSLTASPTSVGMGGASNLTWTIGGNVDSCTASGGWSGAKSISGGNQSTGSLSSPATYTLTCTGPGGSSSDSVTVNITSGPVVTLTASPDTVASGSSSTLTWTVSGSVNSCTATGPSSWSGTKSISGGSQLITNITTDTTFTLACTGPGGTTVQTATVSVSSAPAVNLVATPSSVGPSSPFVLTWTVSNADSCSASGGWSGGKSFTGGNETIAGISSATTYTLTCSGPGGTRSDSVTVNITTGPVVTLTVSPSSVNPGNTTNISWSVSGTVTSCSAGGGWSGAKAVTGGTEASAPVSSDTTYVLSCTGPGGTTTQSATVTVIGASSNYPNAPTISGSATYTNTMYTFNITGTDSSGEDVRYGIDWNMDGVADNWLPAPPPVAYVTSGTSQAIAHSWPVAGTYTFQALTQNNISGNNSGWTTKTVTVVDPVANVNGQCGTANGQAYPNGSSAFAPYSLCTTSYGTTPASVPFPAAGSSSSWTCKGSGTGVNSPMCSASQNQATADVTVNVVSYGGSVSGPGIVNCTSTSGTCSTTVTVGSRITLTATPTSSYWQFNGWDLGNTGGVCYTAGKSKSCTFTVTSSGSVTITASFGARIFDYKEF